MKTDINNCFNGNEEGIETRAYFRLPWNGTLKDEELSRPGGFLMAALISHANDHRMQLTEMAKELDVTYGYINQLRNGIRRIDQISDETSQAMARFLGIPRMTVLMLSGRVTPTDCFESKEIMAEEIARGIGFICSDPKWGHLITPELRKSNEISQFGIVKMYEVATGKVLLNKALDMNKLLKKFAESKMAVVKGK